MDEKTDPRKLEHQIELAERAASIVKDEPTAQRFISFALQLRQSLQKALVARRRRQKIRARAYELWERAAKPSGRDLEFWLQAERELEIDRQGDAPFCRRDRDRG
jgi:hypothetical protein